MIDKAMKSLGPAFGATRKALDSGTEGDTVNIVNLQSKRTVQGVVTGPGQVSIVVPGPRLTTAALSNSEPPAASESKKAE